jgi:predicted nucleic acid-binding protein
MEEIEHTLEELIRKAKRRDTLAAILISSSFLVFGLLALILLDLVNLGAFKGIIAVTLVVIAWFITMVGIYILISAPYPELPSRVVADSSGVKGLAARNYSGKIYVPRKSYANLPKADALKMNLEVISPDEESSARYAKYGEELAEAIAAAKMLRARYIVSDRGNRKIEGIKIVKPEDFQKK